MRSDPSRPSTCGQGPSTCGQGPPLRGAGSTPLAVGLDLADAPQGRARPFGVVQRWVRQFSIRHLWITLTVAAAFIGPASSPIGLPDIYWTLRSGAWMLAHHQLLTSDPFTSAPHVAGQVINVQWLADLVYAALGSLGGLPLVIVGTALAVSLAYALTLAAAITASGHVRLSCLAVWLAYALGASNLSPRPQTLAYPLFGLFLVAVTRAEWRRDGRLLWLLPPACAVWANLHGSFVTGWTLLGCAALGQALETKTLAAARPYALALGGCVLASLISPYGPQGLVYVARIGTNPIIRDYVTEWAPTSIDWHEGVMFYGSVVLLAGLMLRARTRLTATELLTLLAFGWLAVSSVRVVVWWGLASAPILARLLGEVVPSRPSTARDRPPLNVLIAAATVLIAVASLPWFKDGLPVLPADKRGLFGADTPLGAGAYLASHELPPGLMLNHQPWGGYLEWADWPHQQPFLDGRIELHRPQVWFDYLAIVFPSARWRTLLDQYGITSAVLSQSEEPDLIADLRTDPAWQLVYSDDQAVIFMRNVPSPPVINTPSPDLRGRRTGGGG